MTKTLSELEQSLFDRRSTRAFLTDPIEQAELECILAAARQAPSGANLQPGKFHVLSGPSLVRLTDLLQSALAEGRPEVSEYSYFPEHMSAELKKRQQAAGFALYDALDIGKRDVSARREQFARNYRFFDAPVGIVVTIQRDMGKGCFMDLGMSLMSLFLSAHSRGIASSGIGALANHADVVHEALELSNDEMVVCGIALGKADVMHPANKVKTDREALDVFTRFYS